MQVEDLAPSITKMSATEAVARAEALANEIRPFVAEAEALRRMPPKVVDAFMASGLTPLIRPPHYGGYGQNWTVFMDVLRPIAQCSGSMAWCFSFLLHHQWALSHWPESVQEEVYATTPSPKIVTSGAPSGKVTKVEGGYRVTGEWAFGSGGDHCEWAITGGLVQEAEGAPVVKWLLFRPGQFWIRDVWHSLGLKGSGSNNIVIEDAFVPDAFAIDYGDAWIGQLPRRPNLKGPMYEAGLGVQMPFGLTAPLVAIANALVESFVEFTADKSNVLQRGKKAESPLMQLRVGQSRTEVDAALSLLKGLNDELLAGRLNKPESPMEYTARVGLIIKLILEGCDRLGTSSGARGLSENEPFARHWRDIRAITNHAAMQYDNFFLARGQYLLTGRMK